MNKITTYRIWYNSKYGLSTTTIKANSFEEAFFKLPKKIKNSQGWIEDENGKEKSFHYAIDIEI